MLVDSVSMLGWINRLDCNISYLYALCYKIQWIHFNLLRRYVHECSFVFANPSYRFIWFLYICPNL